MNLFFIEWNELHKFHLPKAGDNSIHQSNLMINILIGGNLSCTP